MTVSPLHATLRRHVEAGTVPGAVGLVARGDDVEVVAVGHTDVEGGAAGDRLRLNGVWCG